MKWIEKHDNIEKYVALDDYYINNKFIPAKHIIQTNKYDGLTDSVMRLCIEKLNLKILRYIK